MADLSCRKKKISKPDKWIEIIQSEKQKKKWSRQNLRPVGYHQELNICIIRAPGKKKKRASQKFSKGDGKTSGI